MKNWFRFLFVVVAIVTAFALAEAGPAPDNGPYDDTTGSMMVVPYEHHEVHEGHHFYYSDSATLAANATNTYLIQTPDTASRAHLLLFCDGSAITQIDFYESTDRDGVATGTIFNSNRNSSNAATVKVFKGIATGTTDGTLISRYKGGSATNQSSSAAHARRENEFVLKRNTKYLLRVTSGTNDNLTNVNLAWYENQSLR